MPRFSRLLVSFLSVQLLFGGLVAIDERSIAARAATLETTSASETIDSAVTAYQTIGVLRREDPIDADAVAEAYAGTLQTLTKQADAQLESEMDSDILAAIEDIRNNHEPKLAGQVVDKTLQRVFFQTILDHITSVRNEFDDKTTAELSLKWNEAAAAFEAIKGTAARENRVISEDRQSIELGDNPGLDVQITDAFARGSEALNKANAEEDKIAVRIERQVIRLLLARTYYIGVLREVDGIIDNRERDLEEALIKQKEGEFFYKIIEGFVSINNPVGNVLIKSQLTGNVFEVSANEIVSELNKGFIGRVRAELTANEENIGIDRGRAMEVAEEALLYANIFIPDLEIRLGTAARNDLHTALINLKDASNEDNTTKASDARQTIDNILADYEPHLELAVYTKTHNTSFIDNAVLSYQAIGALRRENPVNAEAIATEYEGDLQQLTQLVDEIYGLSMHNDIVTAIEFIRNGSHVALAAQAIDKTLQRVFAMVIYDRTSLVLATFNSMPTESLELEWDRAYAAFLAVIGTVARENKVLTADRQTIESGDNPNLDDHVTLAFVDGKKALNKENDDDRLGLGVARENILIPMVRAFLIGVLREVEGIIENRERDVDEAREKQIEGDFFYRIVEGFIAQDNPVGNDIIKAQLTGDLANVDANEIVVEINSGLIGRFNNSLEKIAATIGANRDQAMIAAEQAILYANIFLPDLELRLGSLQRVKIENALRQLKEASDRGDIPSASEAGQIIITIINAYENELM